MNFRDATYQVFREQIRPIMAELHRNFSRDHPGDNKKQLAFRMEAIKLFLPRMSDADKAQVAEYQNQLNTIGRTHPLSRYIFRSI